MFTARRQDFILMLFLSILFRCRSSYSQSSTLEFVPLLNIMPTSLLYLHGKFLSDNMAFSVAFSKKSEILDKRFFAKNFNYDTSSLSTNYSTTSTPSGTARTQREWTERSREKGKQNNLQVKITLGRVLMSSTWFRAFLVCSS